MSKAADELRQLAKEAGKRGDKTKSLKEGAREHKREKATMTERVALPLV